MNTGFAVKVIWKDGEEELLCEGMTDKPARFLRRTDAQHHRDFMLIGMEDEVQSINVVAYPAGQKGEKGK